jgi:tRNA (guanine37-N1)-methyltransferase
MGAADDSFATGLLEHPQYTRPAVFRGHGIPEILVSGDHARVARWRREQALFRTWQRRPDLLAAAALSDADRAFLARLEKERGA